MLIRASYSEPCNTRLIKSDNRVEIGSPRKWLIRKTICGLLALPGDAGRGGALLAVGFIFEIP
jgi:hypothetical protein